MKKYVALGCSLTAQDGFVNYINQTYNLEIENLAVSAGSNLLQMHRLNNFLIDNQVGKNTTLLWQITSPHRGFEILPMVQEQFKNGIPYSEFFDWIPEKVNFYKLEHVALLCNNDYVQNLNSNPYYNMQTLMCDIYKWSNIVERIIVYFGWNSMLPLNQLQKSFDFIHKLKNVEVLNLESSIVDWCLNKKLQFDSSSHPTKDSYIQWGKEVLVPVIFKN
jgi:hypothetical protein